MLIVEPAVAGKVTGPKHRAIHPRMTTWPPAKRRSPRGSTRRNVRRLTPSISPLPQSAFVALKDNPEDHRDHFGRADAILLANSAISTQAAAALNFELSIGGNIVPALAAYKRFPGLEGATYYNFDILKNPINDWLVAEHQNRFNAPTAGGFEAG